MGSILLVEDEVVIRKSISRLLTKHHYSVTEAESVEQALSQFDLQSFDLILTDLRLPGACGTDLIEPAGTTPVLVMTSYASLKSAIEAMKLGAVDYIAKPFNHDEMLALVHQHLHEPNQRIKKNPTVSDKPSQSVQRYIAQSPCMSQLLDTLKQAAPTNTNIVIIGHTGTGKAITAQLIHDLSARTGPMVSIDCGAMNPQTAAEQLFGTLEPGTTVPHGSLVLAADQGTLVFEEIGELDCAVQSMILRMLATRTLLPIGGTKPLPIDVRVITTSQQPLKRLCLEGKLREDLYYRLCGITCQLPALQERREDVLLLSTQFLNDCSKHLNKPQLQLTAQSIAFLSNYPWPGNVRELKQCIERGAVLTQNGHITPQQLFPEELQVHSSTTDFIPSPQDSELSLEEYFQRFVLENEHQMTETQIAQKLGISRKTLWERRQKLGIPRKRKLTTET